VKTSTHQGFCSDHTHPSLGVLFPLAWWKVNRNVFSPKIFTLHPLHWHQMGPIALDNAPGQASFFDILFWMACNSACAILLDLSPPISTPFISASQNLRLLINPSTSYIISRPSNSKWTTMKKTLGLYIREP
jgi:hypothetical protein